MTTIVDYDYVKRELDKMNISFDIQTIQDIYIFIQKYIGSLCDTNPRLHIPAAAAIICQNKKIPTIGNTGYTSTGIKIENIMRHLIPGVSKEEYLETIKIQIKKWDNPNHVLGEKINKLNIQFRIFKKYKNIFEELCQNALIPSYMVSNYLSFFWLLFLLVKFKKRTTTQDLNQSTIVLCVILKLAFIKFLSNLSDEQIDLCILKGANFPSVPRISEAEKNQITGILIQIMNNIVQKRCDLDFFTPSNLRRDQKLLVRLVDDLSDQYEHQYHRQSNQHLIDEMTFLELTKDLTPQIHKAVIQNSRQISKVLSFSDDEDGMDQQQNSRNDDDNEYHKTVQKYPTFSEFEEQNTPILGPISPPQRKISFNPLDKEKQKERGYKSMFQMTPITLNMAKQEWAKNLLGDFNQSKRTRIQSVLIQLDINLLQFQKECEQKINTQIAKLTLRKISATDKQEQTKKIIAMFYNLCFEFFGIDTQRSMLREKINYVELLCLSAVMFSAIVKNQNIDFKKYCGIYGINIIGGAKMLFSMGEKLSLPPHIKYQLAQLQKQILIKQIWDTDDGYKLLQYQQDPDNQVIIARLFRHIDARITEICQKMQIGSQQSKKMYSLMQNIIQGKTQLLQKNKLDQIIICVITVCLDLSKAKHNQALGTIFHHYNTSQFSYHFNCEGLHCREGSTMNLLQFYNNVFLFQVQDIMKKSHNEDIMLTPLRQESISKKFSGYIPPISKFQDQTKKGRFNFQNINLVEYRKNKINKIGNSINQPRIEQEEAESPTFHQLKIKRSFTFGSS